MTPQEFVDLLRRHEDEPRGSIEQLLEAEQKTALDELVSFGGIMPRFVGVDIEGQNHVCPIGSLIDSEPGKDIAAAIFRRYAQIHKIVRYAHVSEAWVATASTEEGVKDLPPSKRSDRREVVIVLVSEPGREKMVSREIIRDAEGKAVSLGDDMYKNENSRIEGRFAGLLNE